MVEYVLIAVPKEHAEEARKLLEEAKQNVAKQPELGVADPRYVVSEFERLARKEGKKAFKYLIVREPNINVPPAEIETSEAVEAIKKFIRTISEPYLKEAFGDNYEIIYEELVPTWVYDPVPKVNFLSGLFSDPVFKALAVPVGVAGGIIVTSLIARLITKAKRKAKKIRK